MIIPTERHPSNQLTGCTEAKVVIKKAVHRMYNIFLYQKDPCKRRG